MESRIYLFNSLTKQKERFVPMIEGKVSMYVCGPTVYDYVHVGNMRPVVVFDTLRRFLTYMDYDVTYVSNYTDVDDKIIKKAQDTKQTEAEVSAFYIHAFETSIAKLNALPPTMTPRATEHIGSMIRFIDTLIEKDYAYANDGDVFFRVNHIQSYGELSNVSQDDLQIGVRIEENTKKEQPNDFLLWKKTSDEGIKWISPWGQGRPGWHTECVVMINDIFGKPQIDIHGGGFDLKFPHHENEIAQAKAYANSSLAHYWMHNGFINLNNQKMAKSTGNFISANDFINEYGASALRLLLLSTHYRSPVNLSADIISNSQNEILKLQRTLQTLNRFIALNEIDSHDDTLMNGFIEALADDLNTPNALSELYALIKETNILLRSPKNNEGKIVALGHTIKSMLDILGLDLGVKTLSEEDVEVLKEYESARANKDFSRSDELRNELVKRGIF